MGLTDIITSKLKLKKDREKFSNLMNVMKLTGFYLIDDKKIKNGHVLIIGTPPTSNFEEFEKKKSSLESYFGALIKIEKIRFTSNICMKVITRDIGKYDFDVVPTTANKLYIAKEFDFTDVFVDLDKEGHILIAGQSGTGKTFLLAAILANLIATNSKYIELNLAQIQKGEIGAFANCHCVKSVNYTLQETLVNLEKIVKKLDERSKLFTQLGIRHLTHYIKKTGKAMKRIFFVIEEVSFFIVSESDSNEVKELKNKIWALILTIAKAGRSAGIHFIAVTQRSTVANIGSEVKAQMCCITTQQRSELDSRNIIEVGDAKDLKEFECMMWGRNGLLMLKMPYIDEDFKALQKFVPEIISFKETEVENKPAKEVKKESKVETLYWLDMPIDEYNRIMSRKKTIEQTVEVVEPVVDETPTEEPKKKKRGPGRPKKIKVGAEIE